MAQKTDIAAAKARKQKIILVSRRRRPGRSGSDPGAEADEEERQPAGCSCSGAAPQRPRRPRTATGTTTAVVVSSTTGTFKPAGYVAGVALPGGSKVVVATNKLASFTLFEAKDPFVQQASDESSASREPAKRVSDASEHRTDARPATTTAASDTGTSPPPPPPVVYATITLDGKPQQLKVKQKFPKSEPLFVLVSLKKKVAKIGVAGGSFDDGQTVTLTQGQDADPGGHRNRCSLRAEARLHRRGSPSRSRASRPRLSRPRRPISRRRPPAEPLRRPRRDRSSRARRQPIGEPNAVIRLQRDQRPGSRARGRDPGRRRVGSA